jgi:hypothetical protein
MKTPRPAAGVAPEIWPTLTTERINTAVYATQTLLDNEPSWVHRRVEQVDFLDKGRTYRRMSVDFSLPRLAGDHAIPYIPISVVRKHVLKRLDVRDEHGAALPVLTRRENAPIAAEFLVRVARLRLARRFVIPDGKLSAAVDPEVRQLVADLRLIAGDHDENNPVQARKVERDAFQRLSNPTTAVGRALWDDHEYAEPWISELSEQFILFVESAAAPLERRIIKLSYEENLTGARGTLPEGWKRPLAWCWRRGGDLVESLGLRAYHTVLPAQAIVDCESYHVEIAAPEGVFVSRATLRTRAPGAADDDWQDRATDGCTDLASLHAFAVPPEDVEVSIVDVFLRLRPAGLLIAAAFSSWVTTAIIWIGIYLHDRGVGTHREALTALLVVLPALFAAYLVPGEHRLTRSMFKGLRLLLLVSALLSFTAASTLAIDFSRAKPLHWWIVTFQPSTRAIWVELGRISAGVTLVVSVALISSWLANRRRRNRGALSDR